MSVRRVGAKARLRQFFLNNIGRVITSAELREVAGTSEWARRVRELRSEEGYQILTHNDRSALKPGEYLLENPTPLPAFSRGISKETRAIVLERNGYTCQSCGAAAGEPHPYDGRPTRLHLSHILDKSKGGTDEPSNLRAQCSVCNEGAQNVKQMPPALVSLMAQVRRATATDQLEIMMWLMAKFPRQAEEGLAEAED